MPDPSARILTAGYMCVQELRPLDLATAAAGAGFSSVAPRLTERYITEPSMGIVENPAEVVALRRRADDLGLRISNVSAYYMREDVTLEHWKPVVEAAAVLESPIIVANRHDPDDARYMHNLAAYCELAASCGIRLVVEPMPYSRLRSLEHAWRVVQDAGQPNLGLMLDPIHLRSCGNVPDDIALVDPARIFLAQVCDAPLEPPEDLVAESRTDRRLLGEGSLPLSDYLDALPAGLELECEIPSFALNHLTPVDRLALIRRSTLSFLERHRASRVAGEAS